MARKHPPPQKKNCSEAQNRIEREIYFTSTTVLSGVWHRVSTRPCTADEETEGWLGVAQGDSVKLGADEGSGAGGTAGCLHGEPGTAGLTGLSTVTSSAGSRIAGRSCGTEGMSVKTFSDTCAGHPSGWVSSEITSLTGEKSIEMFTMSLLLWVAWGVPHWDFGSGVCLRVRRRCAGAWTCWTGVWANARERRVTLLGERYVEQGETPGSTAAFKWLDLLTEQRKNPTCAIWLDQIQSHPKSKLLAWKSPDCLAGLSTWKKPPSKTTVSCFWAPACGCGFWEFKTRQSSVLAAPAAFSASAACFLAFMAAFAAARRALAAALVPAGLADAASCFCEKDGTSCFLKHWGLHMQMTTETTTND